MELLYYKRRLKPIGYTLCVLRPISNHDELEIMLSIISEPYCKSIVLFEGFNFDNNNSAYTLIFIRECIYLNLSILNSTEKLPKIWIVLKRPNIIVLENNINGENFIISIDGEKEKKFIDLNYNIKKFSEERNFDLDVLKQLVKLNIYLKYGELYIRWFVDNKIEETYNE